MRGHHLLSSHYLWSLNCVVFTQAYQTQSVWPAYLWVPILGVQGPCWVPMPWKIGSLSGPYFKDRLPWLKKRPRSFSRGTHDSIVMSAHAFLVFLGHIIFWMGMFKVIRWNWLEILIPKHMWKSKIGLLEQIWGQNPYGTFFWVTL